MMELLETRCKHARTCNAMVGFSRISVKKIKYRWFVLFARNQQWASSCYIIDGPQVMYLESEHCTEVRFASLLSGGFTAMAVIIPPEKKLANRTSVHWPVYLLSISILTIVFRFPITDTSYFKNVLEYWYFQYFL